MWQALCIAVWLYLTLLCDGRGALQFHERGKLNCTTCNFVKDERQQEQKQKFKVLLRLHLWSKNSGAVATTRILCYSLSELWYNPNLSRPIHLTWKSNILILNLHLGNSSWLWATKDFSGSRQCIDAESCQNIRFGQCERGGWCWAGATFCWRTMNLHRFLSSPWGRMFHDHFSVHSIVSTAVENLWKARIYVLQNIHIFEHQYLKSKNICFPEINRAFLLSCS